MRIDRVGNGALIEADKLVYSYEVSEMPRDFSKYRTGEDTLNWSRNDYHVGNWRIHPYGDNNDLPKQIQLIVQANADAPGQLKRKSQMLWGKGPKLYKECFVNGELVREWLDDEEIQKWLNGWDYEDYLLKCNVDFSHIEGTFTKIHRKTSVKRGELRYQISRLEHSSIDRTRKASEFERKSSLATHAVVTDFSFEHVNALMDMKVYKLFDPAKPYEMKTAMYYSNMYSFCQDYYTVPDIYGALEWIRRSNAVPMILKNLSKNSMNAAYHVVSPQEFWNKKEDELKANCIQRGVPYKDSMLRDYEQEVLQSITKVMASFENAGKIWHTKKGLEVDGANLLEHGWEIKKIDSSMRDFIKSQIEISDHSSKKLASSLSVHSSIGGSGESTKVNSGSEQFYAMQNYLKTQNDISEMIVCKPINMALKINFPNKNIKMGFYHGEEPKRLEDTPQGERLGQE